MAITINRSVLIRAGMVAAVIAIVLAATFLRQTGIPTAQTMWAEDGNTFAQCAYDHGPLNCLLVSYEGYLHVVPRLAAAVVPLGDPASLPFRLVLVAGLLAAAAAALAALAVADATSSSAAGFLAGVGLALVYPAGRAVSGNITNLHFILLAASVVVVVCSWLGRRPGLPDLVLLAGTGVTSPFGLLLVPLAVVALVRRTPRAGLMLAVVLGASMIQVVAMLTSVRTPPAVRPRLTLLQILAGTMSKVVRDGWFGPGYRLWNLAIPMLTGALLLGLAVVRGEARGWVARAFPLAAVLALPFTGIVVFWISVSVNNSSRPVRYVYDPTALSVAAIALAAGLLARRIADRRPLSRLRLPRAIADASAGSLLLAVLMISFGFGFAWTFRIATGASGGPDASAEIERLRAECQVGAAAVHVAISPRVGSPQRWYVDIPCREFQTMP